MFGLAKQERRLYEAIINHLTEELGYLRAAVGIGSIPVEDAKKFLDSDSGIPPGRVGLTEPEEDAEWEFESGRLSLDEFEEKLKELGAPMPKIKVFE